jgi:hypothetical protein
MFRLSSNAKKDYKLFLSILSIFYNFQFMNVQFEILTVDKQQSSKSISKMFSKILFYFEMNTKQKLYRHR